MDVVALGGQVLVGHGDGFAWGEVRLDIDVDAAVDVDGGGQGRAGGIGVRDDFTAPNAHAQVVLLEAPVGLAQLIAVPGAELEGVEAVQAQAGPKSEQVIVGRGQALTLAGLDLLEGLGGHGGDLGGEGACRQRGGEQGQTKTAGEGHGFLLGMGTEAPAGTAPDTEGDPSGTSVM